jgi:hypothetical protein
MGSDSTSVNGQNPMIGSTTANWDKLIGVFVSPPLPADTNFTGTINGVIGMDQVADLHGKMHLHVFVLQGTTDTLRGTVWADYIDASEMSTSSSTGGRAFTGTMSDVSALAGDTVVLEVGERANAVSTTNTGELAYGGAVNMDLANGGDVWGNTAWIQLAYAPPTVNQTVNAGRVTVGISRRSTAQQSGVSIPPALKAVGLGRRSPAIQSGASIHPALKAVGVGKRTASIQSGVFIHPTPKAVGLATVEPAIATVVSIAAERLLVAVQRIAPAIQSSVAIPSKLLTLGVGWVEAYADDGTIVNRLIYAPLLALGIGRNAAILSSDTTVSADLQQVGIGRVEPQSGYGYSVVSDLLQVGIGRADTAIENGVSIAAGVLQVGSILIYSAARGGAVWTARMVQQKMRQFRGIDF